MNAGLPRPGLTNAGTSALVALRMLVGWHFLYEGLVKVVNPYWTAAEYLAEARGFAAGLFHWLAADPTRLAVVDTLNGWGLLLVGAGLIAGLFTRAAAAAGMVMLALYYVGNPPLPASASRLPSEGSYLIVNKVLIELAALWVVLALPTGRVALDRLLFRPAATAAQEGESQQRRAA
jgi:thiosulfate dehydrogenase (quinone) large subunit